MSEAFRLAIIVCALGFHAAVFTFALHRRGIRPLGAFMAWFRRQPALGRILLPVVAVQLIVFGGSKGPTNAPSRLSAPRASAVSGGFAPEQLAAGFALARICTNETFDFSAPTNASVVRAWLLRGASADHCAPSLPSVPLHVFADGRLQDAVRRPQAVFRPFGAVLGVVPAANWGRLAAGSAPSLVWMDETPSNSWRVTWQNALYLRGTNAPVNVQAEFFRNGDFHYRYDLSRAATALAEAASNAVVGAWRNGAGEAVDLAAQPDPSALTSVRWVALAPEDAENPDRDGDGITTYDEIYRYHTDPGLVDTDGDGLSDGDEITAGIDPLVRSVPDQEILGRLAGSATNAELQSAAVVITNSLVAWRLWDGFAAERAEDDGEATVFERTVRIARASNWQQYFLSARPDRAADWALEGLRLEWTDSCGGCGCARLSPRGDSLYLPLSTNNPESVTFRLVATSGFVRSATPLYLLGYAPQIGVEGGQSVDLEDGTRVEAFTEGRDAVARVCVDRTRRPCNAPLQAYELLADGLTDIRTRSRGALTFDGSSTGGTIRVLAPVSHEMPVSRIVPPAPRRLLRASPAKDPACFLLALDPQIRYGRAHCDYEPRPLEYDWTNRAVRIEYRWPANSACVWRKYLVGNGISWCSCKPEADCGVKTNGLESLSWRIAVENGTATLTVYVGATVVWRGDAIHDPFWGGCGGREQTELLTALKKCQSCEDTCEGGTCRDTEGHALGSLEFRIPLGTPCRGGVSGFAYFSTRGPLAVGPDVLSYLFEPGGPVVVTTNGASREVVCSARHGRTLLVEPMSEGARVTVRLRETGELEHVWEVVNPGGDASRIRLRKLSRLDNVMEDFTYAYENGRWSRRNNVSGLREEIETVEDFGEAGSGSLTETQTAFAADGALLSSTLCVSRPIGEGAATVLRQTHWEGWDGRTWNVRDADYWSDNHFGARNGKLRLLTATDAPWEYHAWDHYGRETLRVEQRDDADAPTAFPVVDDGTLTEIPPDLSAFVTTFGYDPPPDDDNDADDRCRVRCETRFAVRNGRATAIARTWYRYTHPVCGGYAATKVETRRAASASASFGDAGNAVSWTVTYGEMDALVPFALRGAIAEECDEDGVVTTYAYAESGNGVVCTRRESLGECFRPTYEVTVRDADYGNLLRRTTHLTSGDEQIEEEVSTYDDRNRLRSTRYSDGTSLTNAYSCCRLLWTSDREGRRVLRSAVTGRDALYYAEEEAWRAAICTNGHKVTQHFFDELGRETNTVVYVGTVPGEATDSQASDGRQVRTVSYEFPNGSADDVVVTDARGMVTVTECTAGATGDETLTSFYGDPGSPAPTRCVRTIRRADGDSVRTEDWDGGWSRETEMSDYGEDGCRTLRVITDASDLGTVTNQVTHFDFLGREVLSETPEGRKSTAYRGSTSLVDTETSETGEVSRTETMLYDACGACIGSMQDGVATLDETSYERLGDAWWKILRHVVAGSVTNAASETRTQLTGLAEGLRARRIDVSAQGVVTETVDFAADADGVSLSIVSNGISGTLSTRALGGVVIGQETPEASFAYGYDPLGRCISVRRRLAGEDADLPVEDARYDACDARVERLIYTNATAGALTRHTFDCNGRETETVDPLGVASVTAYDARGRIAARSGADYPVRYAYDANDRRTSLWTTRDGFNWDETRWTYDAPTGRLLSKQYADGSADTWTYTDDGLPLRETNASGAWRQRSYDARRRLIGIASSDGAADASFAYDEFGRQTSAQGLVCGIAYARAANGVATNETVTADGEPASSYVREVDAFGRVCGRGLAGGTWQTISYDGRNRIAAVSTADATVTYAYAPDGTEAGWTVAVAGGATVRREVVRDRFLTSRTTAVSNFANRVALSGFAYAYDSDGRVVARNGERFGYDPRGEVAQARGIEYGYDAIGNLVSLSGPSGTVAFAVDSVNRYGGLAYDADGALLGFAGFSYSYDSGGRLASVSTGGVAVASYSYDPHGRRVRAVTPRAVRTFVYDGWNLVREIVERSDGVPEIVEYFWGRDKSGGLDGAGGVEGLVYLKRNGAVFVPVYDANGNIVAYVDAGGHVVAETAYDEFGNVLRRTGPMAEDFRFGYSTKYTAPADGRLYFGKRDYLPRLRRWMTRDPIGEADTENPYLFCGNNALSRYDVFGLLTAGEAFFHYTCGPDDPTNLERRQPWRIALSELDTSSVTCRTFPSFVQAISYCDEGTTWFRRRDRRHRVCFKTGPDHALALGSVTLTLDGVLNVQRNGDWTFNGKLRCMDDFYDFNMGMRPWGEEVMTGVGRSFVGKPFVVEIRGWKLMRETGNCCAGRSHDSRTRSLREYQYLKELYDEEEEARRAAEARRRRQECGWDIGYLL